MRRVIRLIVLYTGKLGYIGDSHFTGTAPFTGYRHTKFLRHYKYYVEMLFIVVLARMTGSIRL